MARTCEEILGNYYNYLRKKYPDRINKDIPEIIRIEKEKMGKNIVSCFASFFGDDEEIHYWSLSCLYWIEKRRLFFDFTCDFEWLLVLTNKKIILFSLGWHGWKINNRTVRLYPLNKIHSVEVVKSEIDEWATYQLVRLQVAQTRIKLFVTSYFQEYFATVLSGLIESQSSQTVPTSPQPASNSTLEQLERLSLLLQQGVLNYQEFEEQKQKILQNR